MKRSLLRIVVILSASVGAALVYAGYRQLPWVPDVHRIRQIEARSEQIRRSATISLEEFVARIQAGAVVIDARAPAEFEKGHLAPLTPTTLVLNVHGEEVEAHLPRLEVLRGQPLVLYCTSPTCDLAEKLFIALENAGFFAADMAIYPGGWEGIQAAGLPTATGPDAFSGDPAALPGAPPGP